MAAHRVSAYYPIPLPLGLGDGHQRPAHGALVGYGLRLLNNLGFLFQNGSHSCVPADRICVAVFFRGYLL